MRDLSQNEHVTSLRNVWRAAIIGSVNVERRSQWVGRLSTEIKQAGFGIGEFAQRMGVNRTSVWRINRGDFAPSRDWTARAEALLGLRDEPQAAEAA